MTYREELENDMKKISVRIIKKALGKIKKNVNEKFGAISKLNRPQLLDKIISLNYKYKKEKNELTTDSMIRKPKRIKLSDLS